ncbi:DUF1285 domain-containing protein [Sphingomonas sp. KRR8]|uniref:DUF1285 domain-containing protein n=1 Tax=Sphingomonas sp. KRR8 TaxID=2942996 RepID=UPI002021809E|nr:DUF1285 domain-containing protein [Sphingomonas sp. KRR8]URD62096.1 DUF1285 domain-containing protein [Sphingomonas sp. KRR8]
MPESLAPIDLAGRSIAEIAADIAGRTPAPVERWHPDHCGDSEMRIARDGRWYHQGTEIRRPALVRQFSRILRREPDGSYVLVTPGEKLTIDVELAAFVATALTSEGEGRNRRVALLLNSGDALILGPHHPLRITEDGVPLVAVRHRLEALLARPVYYELAEIALTEGADPAGVWSDGIFFPLSS